MGMTDFETLQAKVMSMMDSGQMAEAHKLLLDGDAKGDSNCTCILGDSYLNVDIRRAIELFEKAMNMGHPYGSYSLASIYESGADGIPADKSKAFYYYSKGADQNFPASLGNLARCYCWGIGTAEDKSKAFPYGLQAAKLGDLDGMKIAALLYDDGLGTQRDPHAAAHWYREFLKAYDDSHLMYRLAVCLADPYEDFNIHVTHEMLEEAFHWASKAVEADNVDAHIIIAWFYETGKLVPVDYQTSHKFLTIAAEQGSEFAQDLLKRYRKNIFGQIYLPE